MTKRVRFRSSISAGAAVALLFASTPAALSADLVVTAYGGLWEKAFGEPGILWPPFGQLAPKIGSWVEKWNKELGR